MFKQILHKMGLVTKGDAQIAVEAFHNRAEAAYTSDTHQLTTEPLEPSWAPGRNLERVQLIKEMRDIEDNFAPVGAAIRQVARNVVPTGYRAATGDPEMNKQVNEFLEMMMECENFDYGQNHDALSFWELTVRDMLIDGDHFHRVVKPRNEQSFFVQGIRGDLIGATSGAEIDMVDTLGNVIEGAPRSPGKNNRRHGGVIVDQRGRKVAYEKYYWDGALKTFMFERKINSKEVSHIFDSEHTDSIRGVTPFKAALLNLLDLKDVFDYTKASLKFAASKPIIIRNESGKAPKTRGSTRINLESGTNSHSDCGTCKKNPCNCPPPTRIVDGSSVWYLKLRERVESFAAEAPSANFEQMVKYLLSTGAMALDLPYSMLYNSEQLNGGSIRVDVSKAAATFKSFRRRVVLAKMVDPWKRAKILEGIQNGLLTGVKESDLKMLCKGAWVWPADATADEKYSSSSYISLLDKGVVSLDEAASLKGKTYEQVLAETEATQRMIMETAREMQKDYPELPITFFIDRIASGPSPNGSLLYEESLKPDPEPGVVARGGQAR